jgi:hypothetical protein
MDDRTEPVLCPFALALEPMAAMLNFEIADDPVYAGLEIQRFDDAVHGVGLAVLLVRRADRRVDVYREAGLHLDPQGYGIGAGLGDWREAEIEPSRLEVTATGVVVDVALRDGAGRRIEVRADDRDGRRRDFGALLAPVGAEIERPTSMLFIWMSMFDLMRATGRPPVILIDGRPAATGRLPAAWLHRRRLIKVASDIAIVRLNPDREGPIALGPPSPAGGVTIASVDGRARVSGITAAAAGHEARLDIAPPIPDLEGLPDGASIDGSWALTIDVEMRLASGSWTARRVPGGVEMTLDSTAAWHPGPLPRLMRIVTTLVPTFREWPQSYRWRASIAFGRPPTMTSRWERTGSARGEAYGRVMRTST